MGLLFGSCLLEIVLLAQANFFNSANFSILLITWIAPYDTLICSWNVYMTISLEQELAYLSAIAGVLRDRNKLLDSIGIRWCLVEETRKDALRRFQFRWYLIERGEGWSHSWQTHPSKSRWKELVSSYKLSEKRYMHINGSSFLCAICIRFLYKLIFNM